MHRWLMVAQRHSVRSESEVAFSCSNDWTCYCSVTFQGIQILEDEMQMGTLEFRGVKVHRKDRDATKRAFQVPAHYGSIDLEMAS